MATWNKKHDNPMSAIDELIERLDKAEADRDKLVEALREILAVETHLLHAGYDSGSGGGNFVYADVIRTDDDAFAKARAALKGLE